MHGYNGMGCLDLLDQVVAGEAIRHTRVEHIALQAFGEVLAM
jgi:hypothetical protein